MSPFFKKYDNIIECRLCPHYCRISDGKTGICGVRKNNGKEIELVTYGVISGKSPDPVEKKPFYHFFPGYNILSIGSYGCNMRCDFCQNWQISQGRPAEIRKNCRIDDIVSEAVSSYNNIGLAFTYNEPVVWFEFMRDTAIKIKENGLFTVMVSNGYVSREALNEITGFIDAFNIDLKSFNESFYRKLTGADLKSVKESLKTIADSGKHLEITTLIIPEKNDSLIEMEEEARWIAGELGELTPLHLSRYFPMFKRDDPPTPLVTLDRLRETASRHLKYVYPGNTGTSAGQDTSCNRCGSVVTKRNGFSIRSMNLDNEGKCVKCGNPVYKHFIFHRKVR